MRPEEDSSRREPLPPTAAPGIPPVDGIPGEDQNTLPLVLTPEQANMIDGLYIEMRRTAHSNWLYIPLWKMMKKKVKKTPDILAVVKDNPEWQKLKDIPVGLFAERLIENILLE